MDTRQEEEAALTAVSGGPTSEGPNVCSPTRQEKGAERPARDTVSGGDSRDVLLQYLQL